MIKGFIVEHNSWEKKKDLENIKKVIVDVTNFIQLVSPQPVDQFSQTKLH